MTGVAARMWAEQHRDDGGRRRLFEAVAGARPAATVLYPGSYVDLAPSFVFPHVTYVDFDPRTPTFFADRAGIAEILDVEDPADRLEFIFADYTDDLPLADQHFDLLVSLYAGFVSEACTQYLRVGGTLLVNPSHGDVAMASIDPRYQLVGVVTSRDDRCRVRTEDLETYLVPTTPVELTPEHLHRRRRGIAYTRAPLAYLFERIV